MEFESFEDFFFNDAVGLYVRFRNCDYALFPEEKKLILDWVDDFKRKAFAHQCISIDDFQIILEVLKALEMAEENEEISRLRLHIINDLGRM